MLIDMLWLSFDSFQPSLDGRKINLGNPSPLSQIFLKARSTRPTTSGKTYDGIGKRLVSIQVDLGSVKRSYPERNRVQQPLLGRSGRSVPALPAMLPPMKRACL